MSARTKRVTWYEHDCEWITKYCDENHTVSALVPMSVLRQYVISTDDD